MYGCEGKVKFYILLWNGIVYGSILYGAYKLIYKNPQKKNE